MATAAFRVRRSSPCGSGATRWERSSFAALIDIGRHPPDLLLTDLLMPGMDGYRMIRHLRAMPGAKPIDVVAITALAPHEVAERGILPPDVPVILKPLSFATLKELIMQRMSARD